MDVETIKVDDIEKMGRADLVGLWPELFPGPVPQRASKGFLKLALGWKLQARRSPELVRRVERRLRQIAGSLAEGKIPRVIDRRPQARPGTILERTWRGRAYAVTITDQGCVLDGVTYGSLSEVARKITGSRWNGPSFFGLRSAKQTKGAGRAGGRSGK